MRLLFASTESPVEIAAPMVLESRRRAPRVAVASTNESLDSSRGNLLLLVIKRAEQTTE